MTAALSPFLQTWRWPLAALVVSLAMLGAAHAFEAFAYLLPCQLCLRQREVYWAAAAMAATGLVLWNVRQNRRFLVAFNVMLALVFLTGAVVAVYHSGVEWRWWPAPTGCVDGAVDVMSVDFTTIDERTATSSCLDAPGRILGLSMAGWNAVISLALSLVSFKAATAALPTETV